MTIRTASGVVWDREDHQSKDYEPKSFTALQKHLSISEQLEAGVTEVKWDINRLKLEGKPIKNEIEKTGKGVERGQWPHQVSHSPADLAGIPSIINWTQHANPWLCVVSH